jgi:hypothetical protein
MATATRPPTIDLEAIDRLTADLKKASVTLGRAEVRYLVDAYYTIQDWRITAANQARAISTNDEPHSVISWLFRQSEVLESQVKRALAAYADSQPSTIWAQSIVGIGPVLASGLAAHIDITKAPTVGHIWRFAGLDPTTVWNKHEKRPWNAALKLLCWKIGESFIKVQGNERDVYGKVYVARKALEAERNAAGKFADQAAHTLETRKIGKDTDAFKHLSAGHLPPAQIHARARRYAVKLFLAHFHHVSYELHYKTAPPVPYIMTKPEHVHFIGPPNWPM